MFQGNNVKDEAADVALFAELGSSPANMEAGKALDAYGAMPRGWETSLHPSVDAGDSCLDKITQKSLAQRMDWSIQRPSCSS